VEKRQSFKGAPSCGVLYAKSLVFKFSPDYRVFHLGERSHGTISSRQQNVVDPGKPLSSSIQLRSSLTHCTVS